MKAVCLRYFNVFGPRQDPSSEYSGVIARFLDVAAARTRWERDGGGARGPAGDGGVADGGGAPRYVVYGDGRQSRDFVFVADVVEANLLALDACLSGAGVEGDGSGASGGAGATDVDGAVFNVGTGVSIDLVRLVAETERLRGKTEAQGDRSRAGETEAQGDRSRAGETDAPIDWRPAREGDIRASQADISRARRLLAYEPAVSFADGLAATYEWHVAREGES
jgi:UDP-glucose 4-epimerase